MKIATTDITAVILAGGQGRRMGGRDKGLIEFRGRPLVAGLVEQLERQSVGILINANRNASEYSVLGYPVVADRLEDFQGPLAGFASAMGAVDTDFILTLPCDGPLLAPDYVARFVARQERTGAAILVAHDGERLQPVHALIRVDLLPDLQDFLAGGERKIDRWYARHDFGEIDFSDRREMFRNINTPAERETLAADS